MSSASDKARFYLEQSVPELKEYERKKIFTTPEITAIAQKRSDFEHKINARGSSTTDYARYAEFEINVDALRRKRVKRLNVKSPAHNGQRRIFFVFDRGTRKFPGDVGLWMQSVEYAKKQKAYKKLSQILTNALRLHPMKAELWTWAAQFAMEENGDMTEARSYMQRGLRFCKNSKALWLEYCKLELIYIAKIAARRRILGIAGDETRDEPEKPEDDLDADMMRLPALTEEDINPSTAGHEDIDQAALKTLDSTPAMTGAIPMAVFDAAMSQFKNDSSLGLDFYDLVAEFDQLPCLRRILEHIDGSMQTHVQLTWQAHVCHTRFALDGVAGSSLEFPAAVGEFVVRMKECCNNTKEAASIASALRPWLATLVECEDMDPALLRILQSQKRTLTKLIPV
jgi:U3 small nucleolar RNA-associated protein 6